MTDIPTREGIVHGDSSRPVPAFSMMAVVGRLDSAKLHVHAERCLATRHKNARCLNCADVCTTSAISRGEDDRMAVDPDKCIGCGTCAGVCPSGCLEAENPSDEDLDLAMDAALTLSRELVSAGQAREIGVAAACGPALADHAEAATANGLPVVGVVCLGRMEESILAEAVAKGAQRIDLVHGECEMCAHAPGGLLCADICASMGSLLTAVGSDARIGRVHADEAAWPNTLPCESESAAPRASTASVSFAEIPAVPEEEAAAAAAADAATFTHVQRDGTLPHHVPTRRLRLYNSLKRLAANASIEPAESITTRLWGQVTINTELCRSCRMCTVFCPTGAISRFQTKSGAFGVEHRSTLCVQCRLCETICPEQAITVSDTVSFPEFLAGSKYRFEMQPLGWTPGDTHAIVEHMGRFTKIAGVQDLQNGVQPEEFAEHRETALARDERRREIREGMAK